MFYCKIYLNQGRAMKLILTLAMISLTSFSIMAQSRPDIANGESIFNQQCIACHGPASVGMGTPALHGQFNKYLVAELMNFKYDRRLDLMFGAMPGVAKGLSDSDIADVAAYLSKQDPCVIPVPVDPQGASVAEGKIKAEENACLGCHRPKNSYGAPRLDGQKNQYIVHSLKAFKTKERKSHFMNTLVMYLTEKDMNNLAAYMNSLRQCK